MVEERGGGGEGGGGGEEGGGRKEGEGEREQHDDSLFVPGVFPSSPPTGGL